LTVRRLLLLLLILRGNGLIRDLLRGWLGLVFRYLSRWLGLRLIEYRLRRTASIAGGQRGSSLFVQQDELHQRRILRTLQNHVVEARAIQQLDQHVVGCGRPKIADYAFAGGGSRQIKRGAGGAADSA